MTKKYINPSSFYQDQNQFAYGLYTNNALLFYSWDRDGVQVELSARSKMENTFYDLIYEFAPLAGEVKANQKSREKGVL